MKLLVVLVAFSALVAADSNPRMEDKASDVTPSHLRMLDFSIPEILDQTVEAVCSLIAAQFVGSVQCGCMMQSLSGFISYSCNATAPVCVGEVCGSSSTAGSLDLFDQTANAQLCFLDSNPDGVGKVCVSIDYDLKRLGTLNALRCRASVDGVLCTSCLPCRGGVAVDCSNVVNDPTPGTCETTNFVNGLGLGSRRNRKKIKAFAPGFLN